MDTVASSQPTDTALETWLERHQLGVLTEELRTEYWINQPNDIFNWTLLDAGDLEDIVDFIKEMKLILTWCQNGMKRSPR
jgi:hypothetical protein